MARLLVIAAPRPSDYQTWINPGGTSRGALFVWRRQNLAQIARPPRPAMRGRAVWIAWPRLWVSQTQNRCQIKAPCFIL